MTTNFNAKYDASEAFEEQVQRLLDRTWKDKSTRDRDGKIPKRLKVMNVKRIESRDLWVSYTQGRERVRSSRGRCTPVNVSAGVQKLSRPVSPRSPQCTKTKLRSSRRVLLL